MKKLSRIAALLAAGSLLFCFASCSDGGSSGGGSDPVPDPTPASGTTYAWTFSDITLAGINAEDAGGDFSGKYVLAADYKYASTPAGLIMTMGKGDAANGFVYNKIDPAMAAGSAVTITTSTGAVEPAGDLLVIKNVTGPFTVQAAVAANGSSDKPDRYAYIKVGAEGEEAEVSAPLKSTTTVPVAGQTLSYNYEGTDKVNVIIGCAKYLRVYDVKITSAVTQDQSDGTVVTFTPSTNSSTANNLSTLGLIGASVASGSDSIATAVISEGKISVTSVAEGTATITVTDANSKTASFKAIVAEDGSITIGSITKFTRAAPTVEVTAKASAADSADGAGTVTWDALTDLEWSLDGTVWATSAEVAEEIASFAVSVEGTTAAVTGIPAGTYYVRGKASDAYEASAAKTVTIAVEGAALAWTVIGGSDAATFTAKAITLSKQTGIYLPVAYTAGKKVKLTFTVDMASVNADTGNKICGGFAQDDTFAETTMGIFASNKGISNGSKKWSNGGSSNGYAAKTNMWTADGKTSAVADVTFSVEYTVGQESSDGSNVVMTGTISDGTTSDSKTVKQKEMSWGGTAGTVQSSVVPYIYFGAGATDTITVSNIILTVDDVAVSTNAD